MDNQFTLKDGIIITLLAIMVGFSGLHMCMVDRQQDKLDKILARLDNNANATMGGVPFTTNPGGASGWENEKVFSPIVEVMKKPDFRFGGTFTDNFPSKMGRLTPLVAGDVYQQEVEYRVLETLATRDVNTLEFIPMLAKSWKISDDGLKMDFTLREGVRFSDGKPFTSDDVIFTFDWILNPKVSAARTRAYLDKLSKYYAKGLYEVSFEFKEPYYKSFETVASISIMSKAFYSRFTPEQYNEKTGLLIGTGQYRLADPETWTPGTKIELVRNEYYWGPKGIYDRLEYKEIENEASEIVMFGNGEIDRIAVVPKDYENLVKDPNILKMSQHLEYRSLLGGYSYIGWNQKRGDKPTPFADKRVRQAMTYLLDRDKIAKTVFKGYSTVACGPFHPDSPQSDPNIQPYPFDESKGKALLAEAGFKDVNGDGIIEGPDGKPFSFELTYPSGSATTDNIVLVVKDYYARAGIHVTLKPVEFSVLINLLKKSDFEACSLGWGGDIESDAYQIFHSSQTAEDADNRTNYINKELDAAIEAARKTMDDKKRMELWHKVHAILAEDQPYTFLFNSKSLVFVNNRVGNVKTSKLGTNYVLLNPMPIPFYSVPGK